ncbi:MAG: hypothetical protein KC964_16430, partial [Candidatus Omnitrophica bacterium]|nr:hypothetical protein [Candidatus Omnitrophota bacterium]
EIVVATGTYRENIHFRGKNIVLRSTYPEDRGVVSETIIESKVTGQLGHWKNGRSNPCSVKR